ncbi:DNA cytosine methyltransferase [Halorubellus sp. JP-L1]|uniref:DNA cytosine methyltransferase n=1 Tax=Halorubellus sp. JP-L1 TaxID=2715753 RepID=UPI0014080020|nr:DNA cytosine methyltransferase [Halorubellus sp. JP-L1]NHN40066.1 DNA cytosine methyltransferase [Halorubellus sp. JP-L1]
MTTNQVGVVDLYCGVGGFSLGFEVADLSTTVAVDKDETILSTYKENFPDTIAKQLDLGTCETTDILRDTGLCKGDVDIVIGGPPCQGFSVMGKRDSDDDRNDLLLSFADHVVELSPDYFVMENVDGLLQGEARDYLDEFLGIIRDGGFEVREPIKVLNAADFGVPQNRKRLFLLGNKEGLPQLNYPMEDEESPSVEEAFKDLPEGLNDLSLENGQYKGPLNAPSDYVKEINSWEPLASDTPNGLTSLETVNHSEEVQERYENTEPGTYEDVSRYRRLESCNPSTTLRAGSSRDRGTHTAARPIHPTEPRVISVREAGRLQSFPDWFQFHETKYYGMRQIGNSVPPLLASKLGERVKRVLDDEVTKTAI